MLISDSFIFGEPNATYFIFKLVKTEGKHLENITAFAVFNYVKIYGEIFVQTVLKF